MKALYYAAILVTLVSKSAFASSCGATNDVGDVCSIDCPSGQAAQCTNGTGASSPSCACTGDPNFFNETFIPLQSTNIQGNEPAESDQALRETDILAEINAKLSRAADFQIGERCNKVVVGEACKTKKMVCGGGGMLETMSGNLTADGFQNQSETTISPQCFEQECRNIYEDVCSPVMGKLTANNDVAAVGPVVATLDDHKFGGIPVWYHGLRATYINCSPEKQSLNFTHTVSLSVGKKFTKGSTLKNSQTISVKVSAKYGDFASAELGGSFSKEVTMSDQAELSEQSLESFTYSEAVNIPAMHRVVFTHEWVERALRIGFHGSATVDGTLVINPAGKVRISEILTSPADRTFKFSGFVENAGVMDGAISNFATPLTSDQCKSLQRQPTYEPYITQANGD